MAPHVHPLRRWHPAAIALAVAVQGLALTRPSPWLPWSWCAALALALGLAALPALHAREVLASLAARLAATLAALGLAGAAIAAMVTHGLSASSYPRANPALNVAAAALWLWSLHAPLTMSRWWVRARPAQDAALEVAEPLGLSLIAAVAALTLQNPALAWSTARGTVVTSGLCLALGAALLAWTWVAQARRRAWMRRVTAGDDATWELVDADASATADPWTHAGEAVGPRRMLRERPAEGHYRAGGVRVPVAGVGARDGRAWWARRALQVGALLWGLALAHWGAWRLLHVGPDDPWNAVVDTLRAVRVGPNPCVPEGAAEEPLLCIGSLEDRGSVDVFAPRVTVTPSGLVVVPPTGADARYGTWCIAPEATPRGRLCLGEREARAIPERLTPSVCEHGRWCSITWGERTRTGGDAEREEDLSCTLQRNGWFHCEEGHEQRSGRVRPAAARAFLDAVERYAATRRVEATVRLPSLFVGLGGARASEGVAFEGSREMGRELRQRLWPRRW